MEINARFRSIGEVAINSRRRGQYLLLKRFGVVIIVFGQDK